MVYEEPDRVLDLEVGEEVSSSDVVAVLVSDDVTAVDAQVDVTQVAALAVDQQVQVSLAGRSDAVAGTVASVAAAPSSGTSTYAVRVLVSDPEMVKEGDADADTSQAALGSTAAMTVVTDTAKDAVSVPLSALASTTGGSGTVQVLADGQVADRRVTLGTVGSSYVAVAEGLDVGETVVLAELSTAEIEGAAGEVTISRGGRGGFPGGGSGGFPGGMPGGPSSGGRSR